MVSQYSHYKPEQGEWLGQKHKADIYSMGPMGADIRGGQRGPQEPLSSGGGQAQFDAFLQSVFHAIGN